MPGYQSHYLHCIDYIRQGVMCAGDVSLEPHSPLDGPDNGPLDGGWNGIHGTKMLGGPDEFDLHWWECDIGD